MLTIGVACATLTLAHAGEVALLLFVGYGDLDGLAVGLLDLVGSVTCLDALEIVVAYAGAGVVEGDDGAGAGGGHAGGGCVGVHVFYLLDYL